MTTTEATPESKGGRKAWQTSRKRIPKRLDFTFGRNENLFQGRRDSWNDERESEQLGNILDAEKDETFEKEDEEGGLVKGGRRWKKTRTDPDVDEEGGEGVGRWRRTEPDENELEAEYDGGRRWRRRRTEPENILNILTNIQLEEVTVVIRDGE